MIKYMKEDLKARDCKNARNKTLWNYPGVRA